MNRQQEIFWELIETFRELGLLKEIMVVGSWAEYIYEWHYEKSGYLSNLKTMDIDFFYRNINKPKHKVPLIDTLKELDYLTDQTLQGVTKVIKENMEIEFLVRQLGRGQMEPYVIQPINIRAEGLRELELLNKYPLIVKVNDYEITVPMPQAYILHKLFINPKRHTKKEKDIEGIIGLLREIKKNDKDTELLGTIYASLSKKEQRGIDKVCRDHDIEL